MKITCRNVWSVFWKYWVISSSSYTALSSHMDGSATLLDYLFTLHKHFCVSTHQLKSTTVLVCLTEWRISLWAKILHGVWSIVHVSSSRNWGWVGVRAWCMAGFSILAWFDLSSSTHRFLTQSKPQFSQSTKLVLTRGWLCGDSGWTSTQFIICFHLTLSHFIWQQIPSTSTQHECASPIYFSHSLRVM